MEDATEKPPPPTKAAKIQQVITWILEGASEQAIAAAIAETWPDEDHKPLILLAMRGMKKSAKRLRMTAAEWCLEATRFLYEKQVEIGEYAGAMRAVKQISEIAIPKHSPREPQQSVINVGVQIDARPETRRTQILEIADRVRTSRLSDESSGGQS